MQVSPDRLSYLSRILPKRPTKRTMVDGVFNSFEEMRQVVAYQNSPNPFQTLQQQLLQAHRRPSIALARHLLRHSKTNRKYQALSIGPPGACTAVCLLSKMERRPQ